MDNDDKIKDEVKILFEKNFSTIMEIIAKEQAHIIKDYIQKRLDDLVIISEIRLGSKQESKE